MLSVAVHKDIGEYTEKVVGKMSARTLACTAGGICASMAAAAAVYFGLGIPVSQATVPVMACSMPFWLAGFWRPKGMRAEEFALLWLDHALEDGKVFYVTDSRVDDLLEPVKCAKTDRRARRISRKRGAEKREIAWQEQ